VNWTAKGGSWRGFYQHPYVGACFTNTNGDVSQTRIIVLALYRPDSAEAVSAPSRNDVQMKVEYSLLSCPSSRSDQVHTFWLQRLMDCSTDTYHCGHELAAKSGLDLPKIGNVRPWNHQSMAGRGGTARSRKPARLSSGPTTVT